MKGKILSLFFVSIVCQPSISGNLVSSYHMESEVYILDLIVRCFKEGLQQEANSIDMKNRLPVNQIDEANVSASFSYPYLSVTFVSSKNTVHSVTGLSCIYDRVSGDILGISSYNWDSPERDIFYYPPKVVLSERYRGREEDLYFGFNLDYQMVIKELNKIN